MDWGLCTYRTCCWFKCSNIKTTAVKKGDKYIIDGSNHYVTNAVEANVFTVMAVTDPFKGAKKGAKMEVTEKVQFF
jgi:alkylation response protein AidB-like acyl-CoA dehydrogenase